MTTELLLILGAIAGAVALLIAWQVLRRPLQRRLAVRGALRRPGETVLVVAGSLLGTALITGSFVAGDTLDASVRQRAFTQLGPIDEIVSVPNEADALAIESAVSSLDDELIEDVMTMRTASAAVSSDASRRERAEPSAQLIELDFERARNFGGEPDHTGIVGATPTGDEAVVTAGLAEALDVDEGAELTAHLYGQRVEFTVRDVVEQRGLAGFWRGQETSSLNVLVAPGTIDRVTSAGVPSEAVPPSSSVIVSNRGSVEEGAAHSDAVVRLVSSEIGDEARVETVKQELLDQAAASGESFGSAFLTFGMFAIIAGILLLVNIFVMLAEERKRQLGMLRAVGMRRSDLVRGFVIEGAIYSVLAAVLGSLVGIGVGLGIVTFASPILGGMDETSLQLTFDADATSVIGGLLLGFLISIVTTTLTSFRISRINIIRAIRDLAEPKLRRTRTTTVIVSSLVAAGLGALFVTSLQNDGAWMQAIVGVPGAAYFLIPLLSRLVGRRPAVVAAASVGIVWGVFGDALLGGRFFAGDLTAFVFVGILLVFSAVVLMSQLHENLSRAIRRLAAASLALRLGVAYPLARTFRTGLTLGMYALVIFTMTFMAVVTEAFGGQIDAEVDRQAGGFDIVATANAANPPAVEDIESIEGVGTIESVRRAEVLIGLPGLEEPARSPATGIDSTFVDRGPPELTDRLDSFDSESAVWDAVATGPKAIVVPETLGQQPGPPGPSLVSLGDEVSIIDPVTGEEATRRVIGFTGEDLTQSGAFVSAASLREFLGSRAPRTRFFITASVGAPEDVATTIQGELVTHGVEATTFREIVEDNSATTGQFMRLVQSYLALGLIIGVAGLGVVMIRAVRDRRREIGVLRSLGFVSRHVRRAFLLESGFVAVEGILIGASLALVTAAQLVNSGEFGEGVEVALPWTTVGVVGALALTASLIASAWPALQAARVPPATALRIDE